MEKHNPLCKADSYLLPLDKRTVYISDIMYLNIYLFQIIHAAATGDRKGVQDYSIDLGFLTGYESKVGFLNGFLTGYESKVDFLNGFLTGYESKVGLLNGFLTGYESKVGFLNGFLTGYESKVGLLNGFLTG